MAAPDAQEPTTAASEAAQTTTTTTTQPTAPAAEPAADRLTGRVLAVRIVWFITNILLVLLATRFVLTLLGANPANGFANFIYSVSNPFVKPFFDLFSYNTQYGVHRFEGYTLVAMAVYALIAFGITRLIMINKPKQ